MNFQDRHIETLAVIVAGGKGVRMQSDQKKQYMDLGGIPVLVRTLQAFDNHPQIDRIILVLPAPDLDHCREQLIGPAGFKGKIHLVAGGSTRQASVRCGLDRAHQLTSRNTRPAHVLVHDGVRPFVSAALIDACLDKARKTGAAVPVLSMTDTVKQVAGTGLIVKTHDRAQLFRAQTPQAFRLDLLISACDHALKTGFDGTDEASVLEHADMPVHTIAGDPLNIKLTTPMDFKIAGFLIGLSDCN